MSSEDYGDSPAVDPGTIQAAQRNDSSEERRDTGENWIRVTVIPELDQQLLHEARTKKKEILVQLARTISSGELQVMRDEAREKYTSMKEMFLAAREAAGLMDLYRVAYDADGECIPPGTDEMPVGFGSLIKTWRPAGEPGVAQVFFLPFNEYRDVYDAYWAAEILSDLLAGQ